MVLLVFLVLIAAMFIFTVVLPQRRARAARADLMARLSEGDDIVTIGGLHGTVVDVRDDDLDVEIADGVVVRLDRRGVGSILADAPGASGGLDPVDGTQASLAGAEDDDARSSGDVTQPPAHRPDDPTGDDDHPSARRNDVG